MPGQSGKAQAIEFLTVSFQIERCYYFLHAFLETAQKKTVEGQVVQKEPVEGRLVQFLLSNPCNDGGQWDMLVNLVGKNSGHIYTFSKGVYLGGLAS